VQLRLRLRGAAIPVVMVLVYMMAVASYLSKTPCVGPPYDDGGSSLNEANGHRLLCATDIVTLWRYRWIDLHWFPYVNGSLDLSGGPPGTLQQGAIEYPVLTGIFMWATGLPAHNSGQFFVYATAALLPVAVLVGWQIASLVGWRALVWAGAPALVLYSVYNWDLLPVAWTLGAVLAWRRGRYGWAAMFLGLGAATKIYPGFFLLPLLIERLAVRDRKGAITVAAAGGGAWLAANVPFMLINFDGWFATYRFQAGRYADLTTNSIYFWGFPDWSPTMVNRFSAAVIAAAWVTALVAGFLLRHRHGGYPWLQVSAAMLFSFLAFNKVYSPQYALWVLPFLAMIAVRWGWWVAFWVLDPILFIGLFQWYATGSDLMKQAASIGAWGKTVLLVLLSVVVLVTPLALRRDPEPAEPAPLTDDQPDPGCGEAADSAESGVDEPPPDRDRPASIRDEEPQPAAA
jgi:uncharacterized membrane protein